MFFLVKDHHQTAKTVHEPIPEIRTALSAAMLLPACLTKYPMIFYHIITQLKFVKIIGFSDF
jgi:hypothetical protein